tara:strand:- start:14323 stop:14877 length:555 start_codon:yes stop_codon:yes gene_type:complete
MNGLNLILGILPLVVFCILDTFLSVKKALIFALILAALEALYTYYTFGELDVVTGLSFLLLILLGGMSFYKESSIYFKFQPVVLSVFLGVYLLFTYFFSEPFFVVIIKKYGNLLMSNSLEIYESPHLRKMLIDSTFTSGIGFLLHGAITAWAAVKLSNFWWLICRGVFFYLILFLSFLVARFFM